MKNEDKQLKRTIGLIEATSIGIGAMIGAGVYMSLGEAAGTTGGSLLLAVLLGAAIATMNGLSSAELGADNPRAGGAYEFGRRHLSPGIGFVAGWLFLLAGLTAGATFALTFAAYLQPLVPGIPSFVIGISLVFIAILLNVIGIQPTARANMVLVIINIIILIVFVVLALPHLDLGRFQPLFSGGVIGLLQATALLFFAYTGYARPVTLAEEIREPKKVLPRAVSVAIAIAAVLYFGVAFAALGALGPQDMGQAEAPLRAAMETTGSFVSPLLLSLGALIATFIVILTEVSGLSRLAFAMARNGDLPAWLGHLSERGNVPRNAVLSAGGLLLILTIALDLRLALEASSMALLVYYGIMCLSALRLPRDRRLYPPVVPATGLIASILVAFSLPWQTLAIVIGVVVVGLAFYSTRRQLGKSKARF